jgi:putative oxidoreductase
MSFLNRLEATRAPAAVVLVRLLVGLVFLLEGILKFLQPEALGVGRFVRIGIPAPEAMAPLVGVCEILGGGLLVVGFLVRPAALVLLANISVAILSTKVPILLGYGFWNFALPKLDHYGFWAMAHEARTDVCMWLGSLFLLIVGAGRLSADALATRRRARGHTESTPNP